jgi:MarR family
LRRDFGAILALIKAHAILHQASRLKAHDGSIIATIEDYRVVRELVADLVAEGVEASVPEFIRETVKAVENPAGDSVSIGDLAKRLHLDKSTTSRRVRAALDRGYLKNLEDKKGRPARLVVGDPLPDELVILSDPEVLQCC